jgi:hypothetical protein
MIEAMDTEGITTSWSERHQRNSLGRSVGSVLASSSKTHIRHGQELSFGLKVVGVGKDIGSEGLSARKL